MRDKLLLLSVSIIISLLLLEILSGLIWRFDLTSMEIMRKSQNNTLLFDLRPDSKITFRGALVRIPPTTVEISSQGIRDHLYPVKKNVDEYRIIVLGDSIAFGWGVEMEEGVSKRLERFLNKDGKRFSVINFSVPSYTIAQEVETLLTKAKAFDPDMIIFIICDNDKEPATNYYYPFVFLNYVPRFFYRSRLFCSLHAALSLYLRNRNESPELTQKGLKEADDAIQKLAEIIKADDLKVFFYRADKAWLRPILQRHGLGDTIISSKIIFQKQPWLVINELDGHPNAQGHEMMAREIYDYLTTNGSVNR